MELQQQRGEEMDAMLTEKDKRLAEKEAYIVHLQTGLAGDHPITAKPTEKVMLLFQHEVVAFLPVLM